MKNSIYLLLVLVMVGCKKELDLKPFDKLSPDNAFKTESDLQLYANSFYNILPSGNDIIRGDVMSDYLAGKDANAYIRPGAYTATQANGWDWKELRNINYFLEHYGQANVTTEARNHYAGLARFFRAMFYFEKVKRFGDVPWYNKTMTISDPDLYKGRDPRVNVMDSVLADLDFACANIRAKKDNSCSQITKWVALAFKSRVCLFEGTFRKYRSALNLPNADVWLKAAASAAAEVRKSGQYKLNASGDPAMNYRNLFINETPNADEVILAYVCNKSWRVFNDANWFFTSATYGNRLSLVKTFTDTYLNRDGSRFTDKADFDKIPFQEEVKNRDLRLQQTIRMGKYNREGQAAPPDFTYSYTGYQPLKYTLDAKATDGVGENNNSIPIIRYAEVLLNEAEAKAVLNDFSPEDWNQTIKLLRNRAGIQQADMPVTADPFLMKKYFPGVSDAVLLEIRRERGIELALEGFRFYDLIRWDAGKLLENVYDGLYVAAMDVLMDLNEDGKPDVSFVKKTPATKVPGVYYFLIDDDQTRLSEGTKGNLIWLSNIERKWETYKYVYPIPYNEIVLNPALKQNKDWQ
ncbi:RagB/SusD family nutrient uptake outer membrane protein [Chitinophaga nivalis]|uniref:RagB/SusD family nutrient uptake outer membrane protein n=1 Tax=Chitinophaga nivalis TaxID=2991709 RepID=A0ABT3IFI9_9BACT|nr:RagB/SusD family nutrient uptake outer membrane protein [Chitinophaga nivalis]MCW3467590.1 RagB/SusD family nutrient uptake outer membrane protein [Chitinophaga nivalis]MCW3482718.1 RagB/SusD family nutrient uptake outer membrane protein [Chitinophaga nivalis]